MSNTRKKDTNWKIDTNADGTTPIQDAHLAVFMDIRDELKVLNRLLHCPNFVAIPGILTAIRVNTIKARKRKRAKQ